MGLQFTNDWVCIIIIHVTAVCDIKHKHYHTVPHFTQFPTLTAVLEVRSTLHVLDLQCMTKPKGTLIL